MEAIIPTKMELRGRDYQNFYIPVPSEGTEKEKMEKVFLLPGSYRTRKRDGSRGSCFGRVAIWNGHEFEVAETWGGMQFVNLAWFRFNGAYEIWSVLYYPIDSRMLPSDIAGAVRAYPNSDNTGWLFAHTQEGTHHDYELTLLAACDGVFQPLFRQFQVDMLRASTRPSAEERFKLLAEFYGAVILKLRATARGTFLGEREQKAHPKEGWLDRDLTEAVIATKTEWASDRPTDAATLSQALTYVTSALAMPSVETRWDKEARLEAEKKKEAAEAEQGGENAE